MRILTYGKKHGFDAIECGYRVTSNGLELCDTNETSELVGVWLYSDCDDMEPQVMIIPTEQGTYKWSAQKNNFVVTKNDIQLNVNEIKKRIKILAKTVSQ